MRVATARSLEVPVADAPAATRPGVLLALLALSYLLAYFDRTLMVVLGETIKHEFALSDKQLSLLTGLSFVLIYGLLGIVSGWLLDRYSRKRILVGALAFWSVATMLCGLAHSYVQLALARAGVGIGEAPNMPAGLSMIGDVFPPHKRSMASSLFYAGSTLGVLAAFTIGTWIAVTFSWRTAFVAAGPPGLLLAIAIIFMIREPARERVLTHGDGADGFWGTLRLVGHNRPLVWLLVSGGVAGYANVGLLQWLPMFFARSHGLSISQVALFFGPVLAGGMTVGVLLGGVIGSRIGGASPGRQLNLCAAVMVGLVLLYLAMFSVRSLPVALGFAFVGTAFSVLYTPMSTAAWQAICDPRARGTMAGLTGFVSMFIGGAACTFATGALSDALRPHVGAESLRYALMASMIFCLIAAALYARAARLTQARE